MKFSLRRIEIGNECELGKVYEVNLTKDSELLGIDIWAGGFDIFVLEGYTDPIERKTRKFVVLMEDTEFELDDIIKTPRLIKRNVFPRGVDRYYLFEIL